MGRLRAAMSDRYKNRDEDVKIHTPRNLETLELSFRGERVAKVNSSMHTVIVKANSSIIFSRLSVLLLQSRLSQARPSLDC